MQEEKSAQRRIKPLQEQNLNNYYLFGKTFQNPKLCNELFSLILGKRVSLIESVGIEKELRPGYEQKGVRLDVIAIDKKGIAYEVEMENRNHRGRGFVRRNLGKRMRYYQAAMDTTLLKSGEGYEELARSNLLFICSFNPVKEGKKHIYFFRDKCLNDEKYDLQDDKTWIILTTEGQANDIKPELKDFLRYLKCSTAKNAEISTGAFTKMVHKEVERIKADEALRREYMTIEKEFQDRLHVETRAIEKEFQDRLHVETRAIEKEFQDRLHVEARAIAKEWQDKLQVANSKAASSYRAAMKRAGLTDEQIRKVESEQKALMA